ncbi:conserved hypothetical protein [sediment metagenome]|uniref:DUF4286 domain-containing protein n=1 Tax=sediment metagenome TaxID=749907 RepID=D9PHS9_9ZZZZ
MIEIHKQKQVKFKNSVYFSPWRDDEEPMIIYNTTINIQKDAHDEWLNWMKNVYLQEAMNTGFFVENKICKVLIDEEQGITYSVQLSCKTMDDYQAFKQQHAPRMQQLASKYANKLVAFSTLLQEV